MSGRPTAEIVADLRSSAECVVSPPCDKCLRHIEAAGRLTELDAEGQVNGFTAVEWYNTNAVHKEAFNLARAEVERVDALRPPCPTCGGKQLVDPRTTEGVGLDHCPDCVDGKVSIERLVAVFNAVMAEEYDLDPEYTDHNDLLDHLRSIR